MENPTCVGTYLTIRLKQLGVNHLFSVPGDYTSNLLEIVNTQNDLKCIQRIGNCNALNAGYAADGYARANGLGAVAVTTGVGSFSLLNAIGGAYVEKIPVVVIIGTLSNSKLLEECNEVKDEELADAEAMIMFSCKARHLSLGPMVSDEIDQVKEVWDAPMAGFFSYGEMGKATKGKHEFHNNTCSLVVFSEK